MYAIQLKLAVIIPAEHDAIAVLAVPLPLCYRATACVHMCLVLLQYLQPARTAAAAASQQAARTEPSTTGSTTVQRHATCACHCLDCCLSVIGHTNGAVHLALPNNGERSLR